MNAKRVPAQSRVEGYKKQARELVRAFKSRKPAAIERIKRHHPHMGKLANARVSQARFVLADAQLIVAREHGFESWPRFAKLIRELNRRGSPVAQFETAVEAIINGTVSTLQRLLRDNPALIRARSLRQHRSTLLHYVGANGVEDFRQQTPKNAVQIAEILLKAGAEVDARAEMYGGSTTLGLVATSIHPLRAGVQNGLMEILLKHGAAMDSGGNIVNACLANGRRQAAEFLARRGARLDLEGAAGVGRLDLVQSFFREDGSLKKGATTGQMKDAFAWACEYGRTNVVSFLLQTGMDVDVRLKHNGQTGLHWAAYCGHVDTVKLLLKRNAPVNAKDESFDGTPLGWALYGWAEPPPGAKHEDYYDVVMLLVAARGTLDPAWLNEADRGIPLDTKVRKDPRMLHALNPILR
jgi:hypothetical protein